MSFQSALARLTFLAIEARMQPDRNRLLMIGLQGSGKSTFLGALWHAIDPGSSQVGLSANALPHQRAYLNELRRKWEEWEEIGRTSFATSVETSVELIDTRSGKVGVLSFPDLSGEHFERQWAERRYRVEYADLVASSAGALLFVHPSTLRAPVRITALNELHALLAAAPLLQQEDPNAGEPQPQTNKAFDPKLAPVATQIVEVLQVLVDELGVPHGFPLAVIVSAWDIVASLPGITIGPEEFIRMHGAMLEQYINAPGGRFRTRFYGISAQGGDLKAHDPELETVRDPLERISVVGEDAGPHDISAPVRWLMQISP